MDKIIIILAFFFFSCGSNRESSPDKGSDNKDTLLSKTRVVPKEMPSDVVLHNWQLLDTANRKNIFEDTVPVFLKDFARKNEFPCPDTFTGCAACGHCAYIQLSDDWSYFAYERQETKHYCEIKVYEKTSSGIIPLDTLYGTVITALPVDGNEVYQLTLLEAYWKDERPMNVEFYQFENGNFVLKDSIVGQW